MTDMAWLKAFPELSQMDAPLRGKLLSHARELDAPAGHVLFRDGEDCKGYVMVVSGSVRVQKMDAQGREIVLYRVEAGQTCMLTTACLLGGKAYPAEGIAEEDTRLALLPANSFAQLMEAAVFRRFVMAAIGSRIADLMLLVEDVAFGRMDVRLARLLLRRSGEGQKPIAATHQDLAIELGTAREVISRIIKDFERRGWVRLARGEVCVNDTESLRSLAASDV
ncbi:MAG: Crp/Fnr family transcriptional regulator [Zetaproteobacteria bacterium]|nr:MAG: Crp/Fnr family transcriptional regulator [Zetaproteobacteria bacterium]